MPSNIALEVILDACVQGFNNANKNYAPLVWWFVSKNRT
jgi:hypothetical protein